MQLIWSHDIWDTCRSSSSISNDYISLVSFFVEFVTQLNYVPQIYTRMRILAATTQVCMVAYVMDSYCINRGTLLDNQDLSALENPSEHTVHCMVDVDHCREGGYEVLRDAISPSSTYCRAYRLDDVGNSLFIEYARSVGSCSTCSSGGTVSKGLKVTIKGEAPTTGELPILSVTEILPESTGCGTNLTVPSDDTVTCSSGKYIPYMRAHGTLMIVGWGFLLPSGVIMANLGKHIKNAFWFQFHRANQVVGLCVAFAGWVLALHEFDVFSAGTSNISFVHGTIGIVVMTIGLLQPVNAFFRPHKEAGHPKSAARTYWEYLHKGFGYSAVVLAIAQIAIGISILSKPNDILGFQIGYACVWFLLISLIVVLVVQKKKTGGRSGSGTDTSIDDKISATADSEGGVEVPTHRSA